MSNVFSNVWDFALSSNSPAEGISALRRPGGHVTLVWMQECFKIPGVVLKGQQSQLGGISTIQLVTIWTLKSNYSQASWVYNSINP